jgi:hypothetical protein
MASNDSNFGGGMLDGTAGCVVRGGGNVWIAPSTDNGQWVSSSVSGRVLLNFVF